MAQHASAGDAPDPPSPSAPCPLPLHFVLLDFARNAVRSHGPRAIEVLRHVRIQLTPRPPLSRTV